MALLAKGSVVSFLVEGNEYELFVPRAHLIVHDPMDEILRSCDFYVVPFDSRGTSISDSDLEMRALAKKYYGNLDDLCEVGLEIPLEGWEFLVNVTHIRYRREGFLADDYQHKYAFPQPVYYNDACDSYKLASPDHCIANHRGFVHP
jgi:hypothetical protein